MFGAISKALARNFPNWHWRRSCPCTIKGIAEDFVQRWNDSAQGQLQAAIDYNDGFAQRRRICSIYGVATH